MKVNTIFLIIGLILSVISKVLQFGIKSRGYIGNIIVIPAAVCFCLAILFSIQRYYDMFFTPETQLKAIRIAIFACGALASFQLMMIFLLSNKKVYGLFFSIPFLTLGFLFIKSWFFRR